MCTNTSPPNGIVDIGNCNEPQTYRHLKYSFVIQIMNICNKQHSLSLDNPTLDDDISLMEAIYKDRKVVRTWKWDAIGIYFICTIQRHLMPWIKLSHKYISNYATNKKLWVEFTSQLFEMVNNYEKNSANIAKIIGIQI